MLTSAISPVRDDPSTAAGRTIRACGPLWPTTEECSIRCQLTFQVADGWLRPFAWDRVVGLEGARVDIAMLETSDGHGRLELMKFHAPPARIGDRPSAGAALI